MTLNNFKKYGAVTDGHCAVCNQPALDIKRGEFTPWRKLFFYDPFVVKKN